MSSRINNITSAVINSFSLLYLVESPLGTFEPLTNGAYTIMCHGSNDICDIMDTKFPHIKLPDKKINVFLSCGSNRYTKDEWRTEEQRYFRTLFCLKGDINIKESIQLPPYQNTDIAKLCSIIKSLFSKHQNGLGAVITQYNPVEHIKFFNYSLSDVSQNLHLIGLNDCTQRYNESALIFIHYLNAIIYIRHTLSDDISTIEHELKMCKEDLLLFLFVNRELALSGDICFLNIVAAPNFTDTESKFACENSFNPIIGASVLCSEKTIKYWWDNIFMSYIKEYVKSSGNNTFMNMLSSVLTYMATIRIDVPTLLRDSHQQIQTLLLSNEQFRAVHYSNNKKIIVGGFGSGKSVVGMCQLRVLVDSAKTDIKIFYICYDTKSLHIHTMKRFVESLNVNNNDKIITCNLVELCKYLILDKIPSLSTLIDILLRKFSNQTIHLILDEFNGETMDISEAEKLKRLYDTTEGLQDSTVLLIAHSLEPQRTYTSYDKKIYPKTYNYEATGMQVIFLSNCIRNPIKIFNLNKRLQDELSMERNVVYHPAVNQEGLRSEDKIDHTDQAKLPEYKHGNESNTTADYISFQNPVDHEETRDIKEEIIIEDIAPGLSTEICNKDIRTETYYRFHSSEDVWHSIEGKRPLLLVFDKKPSSEEDSIAKLAISIEDLCFRKNSNALFIANTSKGSITFQYILQCLDKLYFLYGPYSNWDIINPKTGERKTYNTLPDNGNILTNYHGVRGIEARQVLIFIDRNDKFYWQYLVECSSRSTDILVLVTIDTLHPSATNIIYRSLKKLIEDNRIDIVTICGKTIRNRERPLQIDPDHPDQHIINVNSYKFHDYIAKIPSFKAVKCNDSTKQSIQTQSL